MRGSTSVGDGRLLLSEFLLVLRRRRNQVLLGLLALVTVLIGVAVDVSGPARDGEGPAFLRSITDNGLFLSFTALVVSLPVFLPLVVSVVSGESIAGEASTGTLRYLLVVPVDRTRLLVVKLLSVVLFGLLAAVLVAVVGAVVGAVLFPIGELRLLSGTTVSYGQGLLRLAGVALYVAAVLATVAALGVFVSTLTEVPIAAMAATALAVVLVEVLDAVPQLSALHPWLFTHDWLAFGDLLRDPVSVAGLGHGLLVQACWDAVLVTLAWARMTTRDVTS
ncbi:MAG: type transport system permease protein [Modestobacter sp.]|nr:type transport system permease protein [Modestobacter sp.]MCW2619103.1 type transport system permease protein [Modestobacter sp.]